jgi:TonB-linked SusC/RagA family outer membrane protein
MMRGVVCGISVGVILCSGAGAQGPQPLQLASREPAFYAIVGTHIERAEAGSFAALRERLVLRLHNATIPEALTAIQEQTSLRFTYKPSILPAGATVRLDASDITVAAALTQILLDADVDVEIAPYGQATIVARNRVANQRQPSDSIIVRGTITDSSTHGPLAGAVVRVAGGTRSATSGLDGLYSITGLAPGTYRLVVRRLGYLPTSVEVTASIPGVYKRDIALTASPAVLDQVVTTVTGDERLRSIGNNIATIRADSIVPTAPVTSLGDVINARAAGVQVINAGGVTGASPVLYIRGAGSLSQSTQPLVYVDGIRVANSYAGSPTFSGGTAGRFNDVAPEDIESIEVVKGPSAATLYGTDAANGVILITTKRGQGGATRWTVYGEGGALTADAASLPYNYTGWGHAPGTSQEINSCTLDAVAAGSCIQDSVTKFSPLHVGSLTPIGTGNREQAGAQVSGGAKSMRYFISGDYTSETAPLQDPSPDQRTLDSLVGPKIGSGYVQHPNSVGKYDGRLNLTASLGQNADVAISSSYLSQTTQIPVGGAPLFAAGGPGYRDQNDGWGFFGAPETEFSLIPSEETHHFTGAVTSHWTPVSWLTTRATVGLDASSDMFTELQPAEAAPVDGNPGGYVFDQQTTTTLYSVDLGSTARLPLTSWLVSSTSIGAQYHRVNQASTVASATQLSPGATSIAGGLPLGSQSDTQSVVAGVYAQEELALNDRLFLTGAVRVDGANDFGQKFQTATYPKGGVSWLVSRESFFPTWHWLSLWRLRGAYGESGTQPGIVLTTLATGPVTIDGVHQTGVGLASLGNPQVQPERQKEIEAGSDLDLVDSRIHIEFTYYRKRNVNALYNVPLGASLGVGSIEENIGQIQNWGYEALLSAELVSTRSFAWGIALNGSINHNRVVTLGPYFQPIYGQYGNTSVIAGYPLFSMLAQPYSYVDANHNGIIEPNEITVANTPQFVGGTIPGRQLTAATHVDLFDHRVRIGAQFDYRGDFVIPDQFLSSQCFNGTAFGTTSRSASLRQQAACVAYTNYGTNDGIIFDGSFLRFRELSLTLAVPDHVAERLRARSLSLTLSARNLALWTHFPAGDPESAAQTLGFPGSSLYSGGGIPSSQYWLARVNIGL